MPLRLTKRGKIYYVRGTVAGESVYESTGTADRAAAEGYRQKRESDLYQRRIHGERTVVTFDEATVSYLQAVMPGATDRLYIKRLLEHFKGRKLADIDQVALDRAYAAILDDDAAVSTRIRAVRTPLTSILNHAARRGWCNPPAFERMKQGEGRTRWLTPDEALRLEQHAADHLKPLIRFLLCTGARLAEAIELDWRDVDLAGAQVTFWETKSGMVRRAALPAAAIAALSALPHRAGPVFLWPRPLVMLEKGKPRFEMVPYVDRERENGGQIKTAFKAACRRAGLGEWVKKPGREKPVFETDVTPHVCRHTWATYAHGVTKDLLFVRDEGGWATVSMVERYAKLLPTEFVPQISRIWGASHPKIGALPTRAPSVQRVGVA